MGKLLLYNKISLPKISKITYAYLHDLENRRIDGRHFFEVEIRDKQTDEYTMCQKRYIADLVYSAEKYSNQQKRLLTRENWALEDAKKKANLRCQVGSTIFVQSVQSQKLLSLLHTNFLLSSFFVNLLHSLVFILQSTFHLPYKAVE